MAVCDNCGEEFTELYEKNKFFDTIWCDECLEDEDDEEFEDEDEYDEED